MASEALQTTTSILLVEDEPLVALAESAMLKRAGFLVEHVPSGEEAVRSVRSGRTYSIILMDIDLGRGMDGTEAATRILELTDVPIVFLTGHAEESMVTKVKGITRYGYVLKNSGEFVLIESVHMALELFRSHRESAERERRIRRLNRMYSVRSDINQAIVRQNDVQELFHEACRIAVDNGEFVFAWIGVPRDGASRIEPTAWYGTDAGYLATLNIDLRDPDLSQGPTGSAYLSGQRIVVDSIASDPRMSGWRELALARGYRSMAAFPIVAEGDVHAVLTLYAGDEEMFSDDELRLLDELAADIGFAVGAGLTERRRREAEARRQAWEDLMDYVVRHDPSAIAILDRNLNYRFVSDRYLIDNGVTIGEVLGRNHYEVFPHIPEKWREAHRRALAGEALRSEDDFFIREDGSVEYLRWECRPWYEAGGAIGGIILYTEQLTRQKVAESEHHSVLSTLQSLLQHSPDLVSVLDRDGRYRMVSDSVAAAAGRAPDELVGSSFAEVLAPDTVRDFERTLERVKETGRPVSKRDSLRTPDGVRYFRTTLFPAQIVEDDIALVGVISVDLTDEIRTRVALEESEAKYRTVVESTSFGFWITDEHGIVRETNRAYCLMSGYTEEELIGTAIASLDVDADEHLVAERIQEIRDTGAVAFESTHRRKDGSTFPVAVRANTFSPASDRFFSIIEDISTRREIEHNREKLLDQRDVLIRESYHRIKNDMQTVHALLMLQARDASRAEVSGALTEAAGRIEVMVRLYDTIYRGGDEIEAVDASRLLSRLMEDIRARYDRGEAEIRFAGESVMLNSRAVTSLGIIVNELVTNGMKYAVEPRRSQGGIPTITITLMVEETDTAVLAYSDNGPGLPQDALAGRTTGFGMTLLAAFADQLGGSLTVENATASGGAKVTVRFPAQM
ncbi:MAG: PAS domain S-box protein [Spirochaetota bacterium]